MASHSSENSIALSTDLLKLLKELVWGPLMKEDVFQRWCQGFVFSENEPTALVQYDGGPCAVIAPVQAFLLKNIMFACDFIEGWRDTCGEEVCERLIMAMCDILEQVYREQVILVWYTGPLSSVQNEDEDNEIIPSTNSNKLVNIPQAQFHANLSMCSYRSLENVKSALKEKLQLLQGPSGVILFLYSVLLTKGVENINNEREDTSQPLIDPIHGHGSQSLINLLLTGQAAAHVFDNEKDISGLKLRGISRQSTVGFLTLLEHLRYCEVGWFLKCPKYPIWLMGSETHLTIVFSEHKSLVAPETPEEAAKRVFKSFDPEGNGFISAVLLGDVLSTLDLVSDPPYVDVMKKTLDPEQLGVITLQSFLTNFFPNKANFSNDETFKVFHYNGQPRACQNKKVTYSEGEACVSEFEVPCVQDSTPILTCLQTKWHNIEVHWKNGANPSLN